VSVKVTFGKGRETHYRVFEYPVRIDGVEVAVITSSSYDRHARRSTDKGYEISFYLRREGFPPIRISASGPTLKDTKWAVLRRVWELTTPTSLV
jgi:hypothetical protein